MINAKPEFDTAPIPKTGDNESKCICNTIINVPVGSIIKIKCPQHGESTRSTRNMKL